MPKKKAKKTTEKAATTAVKVSSSSLAPALAIGALGLGAYLLLKDREEPFIPGLGGLGDIWGGLSEGAAGVAEIPSKIIKRTTTIISETGEAITDVVTVEPETTKSPKTKAAIKARSEPDQPWTLSPHTVSQLEAYVSTPGGVVEEQLEKYIPKKVPTGELSEYTPEEQKRTVFEDKQYKGPSLFGWLTRPVGAITGVGLGKKAQEGVYVPGVGIAPKVTLPKTGWSKTKATRSRKAGTSGLYTPTIIKRESTSKPGKLSGYPVESDPVSPAARRGGSSGAIKKAEKKEKEKERKAGTDIYGRSPIGRR